MDTETKFPSRFSAAEPHDPGATDAEARGEFADQLLDGEQDDSYYDDAPAIHGEHAVHNDFEGPELEDLDSALADRPSPGERARREMARRYLAPAALAASKLPNRLRAYRSWRYFKTSVVVAAVAAVFLVAAAPLASRDYRINAELAKLRRSADQTQRKLAVSAPAEERKLRPLFAEAERLTQAERVAGGNYRGRAAADAWGMALDQARRSVGVVHRTEKEAARRWKELFPKAKLAVEKSRHLVASTPGMQRASTRNLERAQSQWATAQSFAAAGRYDKAVEAALVVIEATGAVQKRWDHIHDRFDDPALRRQWRSWTDATIAESRQRTTVLIDKLNRKLIVYKDGQAIATFHAELGSRGLERKLHAGDKATPEGRYKVTVVKDHGQSKYYRAFLINYPNSEDVARFRSAKKNGQVPTRAGIGSLIEIHGDGGQGKDWTDGCIAVTDREMDRLFRWVGHGTPVTIVGTVPDGRRGS